MASRAITNRAVYFACSHSLLRHEFTATTGTYSTLSASHFSSLSSPIRQPNFFFSVGIRGLSSTGQGDDKTKVEETVSAEDKKETEETSETIPEGEAGNSPEPSTNDALTNQVKDLKDALLRSLAEQENTRRIAARDVSEARQFAIKSFAKSLLDVSDNLERAMAAVPVDYIQNKEEHPILANLYEGIELTERGLLKAFQANGLEKFGEAGEVFDPNQHEALLEYPDPSKIPGTIGQVMKVGFFLNKRVLRPAEVGVVKKQD